MALPTDVVATETFKSWRLKTNQIKNASLDKDLNFSDVPDKVAAVENLGINNTIDEAVVALTIALS